MRVMWSDEIGLQLLSLSDAPITDQNMQVQIINGITQ